jgi:hypothetical protein
MTTPTVDIAIGYFPGQDSRGDYALVDFLLSPGRIVVTGLPSAEAVRAWVANYPPAFVTWQWRDGIHISTELGRVVPS